MVWLHLLTKNSTYVYVAQTSSNRVSTVCDLHGCLLPQYEAELAAWALWSQQYAEA